MVLNHHKILNNTRDLFRSDNFNNQISAKVNKCIKAEKVRNEQKQLR